MSHWWDEQVELDWRALRHQAMKTLQAEANLEQLVQLVGPDALAETQQWTLDTARLLREGFLQQNALHEVEAYASPEKQVRLLDLFMQIHRQGQALLEQEVPPPIAEKRVDVHGAPLNPSARVYPRSYIETGISVIDGMNTLVRGQKLPIFSGDGLPHNELAAQIARQARISEEEGAFALIFAALGVSYETADRFQQSLTESGALSQAALFLNLADDPAVERTITPRIALSLAEFLAFEQEMHVLVILTDMTNYGEAVRELSNRREEVPTRKGYPGYLYSDLARLYERCGRVHGSAGSITLLPILTMPNDDITHPLPDLTGYITEGQIVLSRELARREIYPPIDVLASLSRLMKDGIGEDQTRADHHGLSNQLYAAYTEAQSARSLADIIGEEDLPDRDQKYLEFGQLFEQQFLAQGQSEARSIAESLDLGWQTLAGLPQAELTRVSAAEIERHYRQKEPETGEQDG